MLKWVIVAVLFVGEHPINSKLFALDPSEYKTETECKVLRDQLVKEAAENGAAVWAKCLEVDYQPLKTKPSDKKSEVES